MAPMSVTKIQYITAAFRITLIRVNTNPNPKKYGIE